MADVSTYLNWLIQFLIAFIPYFIGGLLAGSLVLAVSVFLARVLLRHWLLPVEKDLLLALKAQANPTLDFLMTAVTFLAQGQVTIPLLILIGAFLISQHESPSALILGINLSGSWLLNGFFKSFFRRQRPDLWTLPNRPLDYSYPSGHSMSAISFYGLLAIYVTRLLNVPLLITTALAAAVTILVGLSRLYLGVHWPSDVVGGWVAGAIWLAACFWGLVALGAIS